jgi:hypothetical protein
VGVFPRSPFGHERRAIGEHDRSRPDHDEGGEERLRGRLDP